MRRNTRRQCIGLVFGLLLVGAVSIGFWLRGIYMQPEQLNRRLAVAVAQGDLDAVRDLLASGADPNTSGSVPHEYTRISPWEPINRWYDRVTHRTGRWYFNVWESTVISLAVHKRRRDIVTALLEKGAFIDYPLGITGGTPLQLAVREDDREMVQLLLSRGAEPNACDNDDHGMTEYAVDTGDPALIKELLDKGMSPDGGSWYAHRLPTSKQAAVITLLKRAGAHD